MGSTIIKFSCSDDGKALMLSYAPGSGLERVEASIGVAWDSFGRLIRYSTDSLPADYRAMRPLTATDLQLRVKHVFYFTQDDLIEDLSVDGVLVFELGTSETRDDAQYYRVKGRVLGIDRDVLLCADEAPEWNWFGVGYEHRTSVFAAIANHTEAPEIVVGGPSEDALPWERFYELIEKFPTTTLLKRHGDVIVSSIVGDYLPLSQDYEARFAKARSRIYGKGVNQAASIGTPAIRSNLLASLLECRGILSRELGTQENREALHEDHWLDILLRVLPALYPQYIGVIRKKGITELESGWPERKTRRELDVLLFDASGNIDVLEVKRPFPKNRLIMRRRYRDNYIPARELSGGISQIEKYIFYLNHLGSKEDRSFSDDCKAILREKSGIELPDEFNLRALNPRGMLLIGYCDSGLDEQFTDEEQRDFDLIRRQYAHITDILTYNDLLERLERMIIAMSDKGENVLKN